MTSNLASEEIANYAQDLRREEEKKPPLTTAAVPSGRKAVMATSIAICRCSDGINQPQEEDGKQRITVSKQFKDKVVKPILKVNEWLRKVGVRSVCF